ncbi:hypothetical protein A2Z33_05145 [Candidatus Gottesmanbacteria bacterium RBG_16_52_11]|uniref:Phosphoribosyltransferase domain-containing protein n=1 Tax=Candidatus Gottesmanbacteria bacterium RBG_16_52_11 TaxID=1798374 RepID=A0A1F5YQD3_9BACT|nr:MAG: hypothetical protein A2Z33_05145 [Candidatus Gottesmanbacteria bacterium RBG_16_52_11]
MKSKRDLHILGVVSGMDFFEIDFYGYRRRLPLTNISSDKQIATFTIIGDVEFTEKAGQELEKILHQQNLVPDCFVGPGTNIVNFVHHMAKRAGHARYVCLRKSIRNYMTTPEVQLPWRSAPKHARKLVINGTDAAYLKGKNVVLLDDVVSTGATMKMLSLLMEKIGARVLAQCAIFKQGDRKSDRLIYLAILPIFVRTRTGLKKLLTEER